MSPGRTVKDMFGWSAGDIGIAIKAIWHVAEAFDTAKGAGAKYASSRSFLRGLVPVLQRIEQCVVECSQSNLESDEFRDDILAQGVIILEAYESFDGYLTSRKELAAESQSMTAKLRYVAQAVLSGLDELQGRVQTLQAQVVNAMAFIGPILAFEIKIEIEQISRSLDQSTGDSDVYQAKVTKLLTSIQDQTGSLESMSRDYKNQLATAMKENRQDTTAEMGKLQDNVENIKTSQEQLVESLTLLNTQIENQRQESKSRSAAEAEVWARLSNDAATRSRSLKNVKDTTSETITCTHKALSAVGNLTGDQKITTAVTRLGGLCTIYEGVVKIISFVTTKAPKTPNNPSTRPRAPRGVRGYVKTPPPDRFDPPRSRIGQRSVTIARPKICQPSQSPARIKPPLPPRTLDPSDPRSKSTDDSQRRPIPLPKPPALRLLMPPCRSRTPSPRSSSGNHDRDHLSRGVTRTHDSEESPSPTMPISSADECSFEESGSVTGTTFSATTSPSPTKAAADPSVRQLPSKARVGAVPVPSLEVPLGGSMEAPEKLAHADWRRVFEELGSRRRV